MRALEFDHLFAEVLGPNDVERPKPDPEMLEIVTRQPRNRTPRSAARSAAERTNVGASSSPRRCPLQSVSACVATERARYWSLPGTSRRDRLARRRAGSLHRTRGTRACRMGAASSAAALDTSFGSSTASSAPRAASAGAPPRRDAASPPRAFRSGTPNAHSRTSTCRTTPCGARGRSRRNSSSTMCPSPAAPVSCFWAALGAGRHTFRSPSSGPSSPTRARPGSSTTSGTSCARCRLRGTRTRR